MTTITTSNSISTTNTTIDDEAAIFLKDIFIESTNNVDKLRKFADFIKANLSGFDSRNQLMVTYPYEILLCIIIFARMAGNITKYDIWEYWDLHNEEINKVFPILFYQIPPHPPLPELYIILKLLIFKRRCSPFSASNTIFSE